jgi:hypothetical protein
VLDVAAPSLITVVGGVQGEVAEGSAGDPDRRERAHADCLTLAAAQPAVLLRHWLVWR